MHMALEATQILDSQCHTQVNSHNVFCVISTRYDNIRSSGMSEEWQIWQRVGDVMPQIVSANERQSLLIPRGKWD